MDSSSPQSSSTLLRRHQHQHPRRRTLLSFRRNQIVSMDQTTDHDFQNLEHFHSLISHNLLSLLLPSSSSASSSSSSPQPHPQLLSIPFLSKLLRSLLSFQSHFQSLLQQSLISNPPLLSRPPLDRLLSDHLDRAVKSLDVLNAVTQSLASLRHSHRQADIAVSALLRCPPNLSRAKTALAKLFTDDNHHSGSLSHGFSFGNSRCGVDTGSGIGLAVQNMNSILSFCTWTLMAAFGVVGGPLKVEIEGLVALQERIWEEVKKKKKKKGRSGSGLVELEEVERCGRALMEEEEGVEEDLGKKAMEFGEACERLGGGLGEFERLLREVFHRILRGRVEVQQLLDQSSRASEGTG